MNVEFIRKLAKKLRRLRHEEHYDQGVFIQGTACGTAACIAGHAVIEAGYQFQNKDGATLCWPPGVDKNNENALYVDQAAYALLDIDEYENFHLFSGSPEDSWPEEFAVRWRKRARSAKGIAAGKERPSRIAADLLDAIADGKVEL